MSNLTGENGMVMPVSPMYGGGGGSFGNWGDGAWIIILLLLAFGGFGGGMNGQNGLFYPFMNQAQMTQSGFDQAATAASLAGINTALAQGFAGQEVSACNRAMNQMQTDYQNQIASMNQSFANAQALDSRLDTISSNQQTCCCENRAQIADLKYTIAQEAAATRAASLENTRFIADKMCQQEIDALKSQNVALQNQLNMANLSASQVSQTAQLIADNTAQTQYIVNRVAPYPIPSYTVPNPFSTTTTT